MEETTKKTSNSASGGGSDPLKEEEDVGVISSDQTTQQENWNFTSKESSKDIEEPGKNNESKSLLSVPVAYTEDGRATRKEEQEEEEEEELMCAVQKRAITANEEALQPQAPPETRVPSPANSLTVATLAPAPPTEPIARQAPIRQTTPAQPGAFSGAPGEDLRRRDDIDFSHVGIYIPEEEITTQNNNNNNNNNHHNNSAEASGHDDLSQALPIDEDDLPDAEAQPFDVEAAEKRESERANQLRKSFLGLGLVLVCIVVGGVILGVLFYNNKKDSAGQLSPTVVPSLSPSESPSSAPSGALDLLREGLPECALASLESFDTPQQKAMDWLENHPNIAGMEESRQKQLFALVTFYYAMDGPNWPEAIRSRWLQCDLDECYWFSSEFNLDFSGVVAGTSTNATPCTDEGVFQFLRLAKLGLADYKPFLPPEIELLTSLSIIELHDSDINSTLQSFLPSQLYQMTNLTRLKLYTNSLTGYVPSDFGRMTKLVELGLGDNALSGPLPSELSLMTSTTRLLLCGNRLTGTVPSELGKMSDMVNYLVLHENALTGPLPSELGLMTSMVMLYLRTNSLTGTIPSELGRMTDMVDLSLRDNVPTGPLPSELGLMSNMIYFWSFHNQLNGSIPTEMGRMTDLMELPLFANDLTGPIPSELGSLVNMTRLYLNTNRFSGQMPSQLAMLQNLKHLRLESNTFTGRIPLELESLRADGSLIALTLANNSISGTIPEGLCSLGVFDSSSQMGLSFDCNDELCGCCWCPCPGSNSTECETRPFVPSRDDKEWPGSYPVPLNSTNVITVNVRTNEVPFVFVLEWSVLAGPETWRMLDQQTWGAPDKENVGSASVGENANRVYSYTYWVESDAIYRVHLFDTFGGYPLCCTYGFGWFTITNSISSSYNEEGTVIWEADDSLDVFIWVDPDGHAHHVEYLPGEGYALIQDESLSEGPIIVRPDSVMNISGIELEVPEGDNANSTF